MADKYHGWSPFNYCLNNTLKLIDTYGLAPELYLIGDNNQTDLDKLKELVGQTDADRISVDGNGRVHFNMDGYKSGSNKNLEMLKEIDDAQEKIGFGIADKDKDGTKVLITMNGTEGQFVQKSILSASTTHRYFGEKDVEKKPHGAKPLASRGLDGYVLMSDKVIYSNKGQDLPHSQIVGHELSEIYYRTHNKQSYETAHSKSNEKYFGGTKEDPINVRLK